MFAVRSSLWRVPSIFSHQLRSSVRIQQNSNYAYNYPQRLRPPPPYYPPGSPYAARPLMMDNPRRPWENKRRKKAKVERNKGSGHDDVLQADVDSLLQSKSVNDQTNGEKPMPPLPERFTEMDVTISMLSSTGDGLAYDQDLNHVFVVPFTVPGDKARVKVVRHEKDGHYTLTDFLSVIEPGPTRDDSLVKCGYFSKCSGCQLQMMSYEDQLAHKRRIVEKAYANFSGLVPHLVPAIEETFPSPLQFGYRTKLTPHFAYGGKPKFDDQGHRLPREVPPIGFTYKNRKTDMDIEDCPLGTDIVRRGLKSERKRVTENINSYKKGATLLMRESTTRIAKDTPGAKSKVKYIPGLAPVKGTDSGDLIKIEEEDYTVEKRCITDNNATSVEYIDDYIFTNKAGGFFQNNNSILSGFTEYIRSKVFPPGNDQDAQPIKYLLDAYSGSGLFTITLSPLFKSSLGVDVAGDSIVCARDNARANSLPNTGFAAADAAVLFKDVPYPPEQTLLVIDPPRKGCSDDFLQQLLDYGPRRVVYVSCNVHTQARDVAVMVQGDEKRNIRYEIESIRGFDFFPQTGHVEGCAILNRATFPAKSE